MSEKKLRCYGLKKSEWMYTRPNWEAQNPGLTSQIMLMARQ